MVETIKRIIEGQPNYNDISQYNYEGSVDFDYPTSYIETIDNPVFSSFPPFNMPTSETAPQGPAYDEVTGELLNQGGYIQDNPIKIATTNSTIDDPVNQEAINQVLIAYGYPNALILSVDQSTAVASHTTAWFSLSSGGFYIPPTAFGPSYTIKKIKLVRQENIDLYNQSLDYYGEDGEYLNSSSLPKNYDKFAKKDLNTTVVGDELNEQIIQNNWKFPGLSFIRIDKLRIQNTGVKHRIKNNEIRGFLFSKTSFNPLAQSSDYYEGDSVALSPYEDLKALLDSDKEFFKIKYDGTKSQGSDLGNLTWLEGEDIISNLANDANAQIQLGDFQYYNNDFSPDGALQVRGSDENSLSVIDQVQKNNIFIAFYLKGDAARWWGTDKRKKRIQVFSINNLELFPDGDGDVNTLRFSDDDSQSRTGDGGSGLAEKAAWKITDLQITINTLPGQENVITAGSEEENEIIENTINKVQPPFKFSTKENTLDFLQLGPDRQLINNIDSGKDLSAFFPDYFPFTTIGMAGVDGKLDSNSTDLQSYYEDDFLQSIKSSAPATITFELNFVSLFDQELVAQGIGLGAPLGPDLYYKEEKLVDYNNNGIPSVEYYYYVVDWDDKEDEIKTIQDALERKPDNLRDLFNMQKENLYRLNNSKIMSENYNSTFGEPLTHTYTTPGIKTLKIIVFSYNDDSDNIFQSQNRGGTVGRWKLITARFFLDIPINQYPDFGELGGSDYVTIPWPNTTPIIGGVNNNSKYKISVQDALSSGNITEKDIIDERFLVNDLENDEMGQGIDNLDLEQVRYFNKSYDMNQLLKIIPILNSPEYYIENADEFPFFMEEFDVTNTGYIDVLDAIEWTTLGRQDIANFIQDVLLENEPMPESAFNFIATNYSDNTYWDGETNKFSEESSVGQIFINDNQDVELKRSCKFELNTGNLVAKAIDDTSGNGIKGFLMGDYRVKKQSKNQKIRRDSFIKVPKKTSNSEGAL